MTTLTLDAYRAAERRLAVREARTGFTVHAVITVLVATVLVVLNVAVASEFPWVIFPLAGMSIGLLAHWYFGVRHRDEAVERHQADVEREAVAHQGVKV